MMDHAKWMREALKEARKAFRKDEVPVGAVAVYEGKVVARGHNTKETHFDPTAHAEICCLRKAGQVLKSWRLYGVSFYTTLEPCPMCAGALIKARVKEVIYGTRDPKTGSAGSVVNIFRVKKWNHHPAVKGGVLKQECKEILQKFFKKIRKRRAL